MCLSMEPERFLHLEAKYIKRTGLFFLQGLDGWWRYDAELFRIGRGAEQKAGKETEGKAKKEAAEKVTRARGKRKGRVRLQSVRKRV